MSSSTSRNYVETSPSHVSTGLALHQRNTGEPGVQLQARDPKPPSQDTSEELRGATSTERFGWTNTDFPPLGGPPTDGTEKWKAWSETIEEELRLVTEKYFKLILIYTTSDSSVLGSGVLESVPDVNGQELVVPETPGLEMSPTTPRTPGPMYPLTPNNGEDLRSELCELKEHPYFHTPRPDRELDPTTLFVGGLEMFGPGAWDEEKVRRFFSRFGGLESVKLVKPSKTFVLVILSEHHDIYQCSFFFATANSCAAFAFVKFDNTESPARAVYEEVCHVSYGFSMHLFTIWVRSTTVFMKGVQCESSFATATLQEALGNSPEEGADFKTMTSSALADSFFQMGLAIRAPSISYRIRLSPLHMPTRWRVLSLLNTPGTV